MVNPGNTSSQVQSENIVQSQGDPSSGSSMAGQTPPAGPVEPVPKTSRSNKFVIVAVCAAVAGVVLPGGLGTALLVISIMVVGTAGALKILVDGIRSLKKYNPVVRPFVLLGSIGVGVVIFLGAGFAAMMAALFKNPPSS